MDNHDHTIRFDDKDLKRADVSQTLGLVYEALEEKNYNAINQIVGYLLSGDPAYIPRHKNARNAIRRIERDELIEELVHFYIEHHRQ